MKFRGVFLAIIFTAVLCISENLFAYSGGDGTAGNPYQVADANDLLALAANTNDYGKCFVLTADIYLTGLTFTQSPIAPVTHSYAGFQGTPFTGIFDGNGHTIFNLAIHAADKEFLALFGLVGRGGQIKNLGVENVNITGKGDLGGLVGDNYGTITACYASGSVSGGYAIGGLAADNDATMTSCYATVSVSGTGWTAGGLVASNVGTVTSCYASGSVSGFGNVGGLVGWNPSGRLISCYSTGSVIRIGIGGNEVGGLAGYNGGTLTDCFWDIQTSGRTNGVGYNSSSSAGVTGKSTADMKTLSTFTYAGWDFSATDGDSADWMMPWPGEDYPRLAWESPVFSVDLNEDRTVDFSDFARLAKSWLTICSESSWCEGADINRSGAVDYNDMNVLANHWLRTYYMLSASVLGGNGTVSPSSEIYPEATVAGLTATPSSGYKVKTWQGTNNDSSKSTTNTVTMNSDKEVTVEFELITYYQLNTSVVGGSGSLSPSSQQYSEGTTVTLTATPSPSYNLKAWHGTNNDSSTSTTNTVTMNSNKNVTVEFEYVDLWPNGGFEMGDLTYWTPSGAVWIDIGLTQGNYSAMLDSGEGPSSLSRTVNLPSSGNYTISFDYQSIYFGYAVVIINGQYYPLDADGQVHTFTLNLRDIGSFNIQILSEWDYLLVDNFTVVNCLNCQCVCPDPTCPECPPIDPMN